VSCPICAEDSTEKYRPFCSRRCADVDLSKWMNGNYAIPSRDPEDIEAAADAAEAAQIAAQKPQ
jgi:uncharacterized protein